MEEIFNIFLNLMLVVRRLATPENADKTLIAISKQKYIRKTTTLAKIEKAVSFHLNNCRLL